MPDVGPATAQTALLPRRALVALEISCQHAISAGDTWRTASLQHASGPVTAAWTQRGYAYAVTMVAVSREASCGARAGPAYTDYACIVAAKCPKSTKYCTTVVVEYAEIDWV